jgi:hypothetical protein
MALLLAVIGAFALGRLTVGVSREVVTVFFLSFLPWWSFPKEEDVWFEALNPSELEVTHVEEEAVEMEESKETQVHLWARLRATLNESPEVEAMMPPLPRPRLVRSDAGWFANFARGTLGVLERNKANRTIVEACIRKEVLRLYPHGYRLSFILSRLAVKAYFAEVELISATQIAGFH